MGRTLYDKLWDSHLVEEREDLGAACGQSVIST